MFCNLGLEHQMMDEVSEFSENSTGDMQNIFTYRAAQRKKHSITKETFCQAKRGFMQEMSKLRDTAFSISMRVLPSLHSEDTTTTFDYASDKHTGTITLREVAQQFYQSRTVMKRNEDLE